MSARLHDPFRYQWFFFLSWHARDQEAQRRERADAFGKILESAWQWAGEASPVPEVPSELSRPPQVSRRLAYRPWQEWNGRLRELEARTLLDCFYLQVGQAFSGPASPEAFSRLTPYALPPHTPAINAGAYVGENACLGAIVGDTALPPEWPETAREILQQELPHRKELPDLQRIRQTALPVAGGMALPVTEGETEILILLYPQEAEEAISRFLYFVVPQLWLSRVKFRFIRRRYYEALYPTTQEQERSLNTLLKQGLEPRLPLSKLEALSARVSRRHASFIESVSTVEEERESLRVSLRNLQLLLEEPVWESPARERAGVLWEDLQLFLEQMETDLRYWKVTRQQSELALQNLLTVAGVRGAQWERRITVVLGVFAAIGLAQVFPHSPIPRLADAWWQAGVISLGSLIVVLASWWLSRR